MKEIGTWLAMSAVLAIVTARVLNQSFTFNKETQLNCRESRNAIGSAPPHLVEFDGFFRERTAPYQTLQSRNLPQNVP
jgi:hypothetical protein